MGLRIVQLITKGKIQTLEGLYDKKAKKLQRADVV